MRINRLDAATPLSWSLFFLLSMDEWTNDRLTVTSHFLMQMLSLSTLFSLSSGIDSFILFSPSTPSSLTMLTVHFFLSPLLIRVANFEQVHRATCISHRHFTHDEKRLKAFFRWKHSPSSHKSIRNKKEKKKTITFNQLICFFPALVSRVLIDAFQETQESAFVLIIFTNDSNYLALIGKVFIFSLFRCEQFDQINLKLCNFICFHTNIVWTVHSSLIKLVESTTTARTLRYSNSRREKVKEGEAVVVTVVLFRAERERWM